MTHKALRFLVPVCAAVLGTLVFHRFSLLTGLDRVQADTGDSRFVAFLLEHWNQVFRGQIDWRSPPIFWPVRGTLAYSDMMLGMGALHAALRTVLPLFAAINLQLVLLTLGTFAAAHALFRRGLGLELWGATAAAAFVAFSWPRFAQLNHIQLQFTPLLPLLLLLTLEIGRDGLLLSRRAVAGRAAVAAALLSLLVATTLYFAVFIALALAVAATFCLVHGPARRHLVAVVRRHPIPLATAVALFAALTAPIVAFYGPVIRTSNGRGWDELGGSLPTLANYAWMGPENLAWGWFFARWPQAAILLHRPELRIGVGIVASLAWAAALLLALCTLRQPRRDIRTSLIVLAILTGGALQVLMLRLPNGMSLWWLVWAGFPGASGIRAVARLQLVVTIGMAAGFGWLIDGALARWPRRWPAVATLVALAFLEQIGRTQSYSGSFAAAFSHRVADAIPPGCIAAFVMAPDDMRVDPAPLDEAHFDAAAYLAANPDVAAAWKGTAWEHYDRFGRREHRMIDPAAALIRSATVFFAYNYTIPLAAQMAHIPVVNGLSGWQPPGWDLFDVLSPAAPARLNDWLQRNKVAPGQVCSVPLRLTLPEIPDPPARLMP